MKTFRSAENLVGREPLFLAFAAVFALVISPVAPIPFLVIAIVALTGATTFLFKRLIPLAGHVRTLTTALDNRNQDVQELAVDLEELSLIDPLTGARNRRGFINLVEHQMQVATRAWKKIHFLFVDIDGMKLINNLYGQQAGDGALTTVVEILWASSRNVDIVGRMGNDEFAVALLDAADPSVIAARIRAAVSGRTRTDAEPYELHVTVAVATFDPAAPVPLEEMLRNTDEAISQEKRAVALARINGHTAPVIL